MISRHEVWSRVLKHTPEGERLRTWQLCIRFVLFPLDSFYYYMHHSRGYNLHDNTWTIHGVRYSDTMFRLMSNAHGETFRIKRYNDVVWMEKV